ncbi:MAG TPA: Ig-like domain-containing protein, partial [Thermoplasmata archaeon]|nr:Ig-like domain-containing protein [Thermoplasmata archaeon]
TTPVAATINVPLTQAIIVDFSKPMNTGGTTVQTSPPSTLTLVWSNLDQTVTASHAANFIDCEPYTVWVNGTDTFGNPLIGGPVPNPFPFTTTCIPPQVASTTPVNGAGNVATNANILVTFSEAMNQGATSIQSSPPVNFVPVNWNGPSTQMTALHLLPFQNCTTYWIYINGTDVDGNNLVPGPVNEPWFFSTACPVPYIVSTDPADGAGNVPVNSVITIVFSEPMQTSTCGVGNFTFAPSVTYTTSWNATNEIVTITPSGLLAPTTNYQVTVSGCQDVDGNGLSNIGAQNPWTFTTETITRPTVGVTAPLGGESFSGNSAQSISFGLADDLAVSLLTVYVNYTYNAGANSGVAFGPLPGYAATNTLSWPTPCINATDVIVNVTAVDQSGESGWDESNTFEIDCAAPTVSSTTPGNTATGVATNVDVRVVFNETMNETTTEAAATAPFSPAVTGITASLSVDGRTLVISHTGAFSPMTVYTVTIDSTAEDDTTPGNAMAADYVFTFTTGARTPGVPTGLAQTGLTSTGVTISWSAPTTYTNADPIPSTVAITYTLYRAANATGAGTQVQTGITAISYTDSGLTAGTSYWYYVTATAEGQTSGESQRLPVTTLAQPLPPDNTMLVVGGILAVVIVLLLLMFLLKRRKKPEEEVPPTEGEAPPPEGEAPPPEGEAPLPEGEMPPPEGAAPSPEGSFPEPEAGMPPLEPAGEAPLLGAEAAAPTKPCPSCGTEVPAEAIECFKCGATL